MDEPDDLSPDWQDDELPYWADPADCLGCGVCGWCVDRRVGAAADVPSAQDVSDGEG